jgi:D-serine deaminase-like pyridoxal phosphate-dependent protein
VSVNPWKTSTQYDADLPENLLTPALAIYPEVIRDNIRITLGMLGNDPHRWRPHLKTVKSAFVIRLMVELGLTQAKCATLLEFETACQAGMKDVLMAMPLVGPAVPRLQALARSYPQVRASALVESVEHVAAWQGSGFSLFVDVNGGMNRTGLEQHRSSELLKVAAAIVDSGCAFGGLHYYDGHVADQDLSERCRKAHAGYETLMMLIDALATEGFGPAEVITAGTPSFPCSISFAGFTRGDFRHVCSPGTLVFNDLTSLSQLPDELGFRPAALVLSRVISRPIAGRITLDAGHKALSVDAGTPNGLILEMPEASVLKPSEEHLPVDIPDAATVPLGTLVHLVPRHVCTTVNNFDHCVVIEAGKVTAVEPITARGRSAPL